MYYNHQFAFSVSSFLKIAYEGDHCENDVDGCKELSCFNDATCTDVPAPGTGATCPPCPTGFTGDNGLVCNGKRPLLAFQGVENFRK